MGFSHTKPQVMGLSESLDNIDIKELFADKVAAADIEVVATTNHNSFDFQQFTDFSTAVKPVQVRPGAEFDVEGFWKLAYAPLVIVDPRKPHHSNNLLRILRMEQPSRAENGHSKNSGLSFRDGTLYSFPIATVKNKH